VNFSLITYRVFVSSFILFSSHLFSSIEDYYPEYLGPSSSNYGGIGLLEMPNARFSEEGTLKFGISSSYPNEYTYIVATPFPWLEATYRYAEIKSKKYGPYEYSGNQSFKDKGFDLKFRLLKESYYLPELALGIRDIAGTGLFASEYLASSKRLGNFDLTLGIGWGELGSTNNIRNPFMSINQSFRIRNSSIAEGGTFKIKNWFSGQRASIYGGVEYYLQKHGLTLKLEYDTTNLDESLYGNITPRSTRYNFGISKPFGEWLNLGISYERGSEIRLSFSLKGNYSEDLVPKKDPPKNIVRLNKIQKNRISENKEIFYRSLNKNLRDESIYLQGASLNADSIDVIIAQSRFRSYPRALGRTARIASALSPDQIKQVNIITMNGDLAVSSINMSLDEYDSLVDNKSSFVELLNKTKIITVGNKTPTVTNTDFQPRVNFPEVSWSMAPALRHQIGGPEAFYLGQFWWKINSRIKFQRGLSLNTVLGLDIFNTFDQFSNPSYSSIPHVRSDIQEYLSEGKNNIARMKLDYMWSPRRDLFARLDLGYLEEMFGGVGGEVYYRPFNKNYSTSFTWHKVKQRSYNQRFTFRDYSVETGHIGFYYDLPKGIQSQLLIGKYLAGDRGATVDLSRRFKSGFTLGIFATKTDISSEEFGEGSFDKGFYFSIPIDLFYTKYQTGSISFGMHPLTKDGGAILNHQSTLYGLLGDTNRDSLLRDWQDLLD